MTHHIKTSPPTYVSAEELFSKQDNRVPIACEFAIRGLLAPFESLFPNKRVPTSEQEAVTYILNPKKGLPVQPIDPEMKRDWIYGLWCEVMWRLEAVYRFESIRQRLANKAPSWRRRAPLILFLRKFRRVDYHGGPGFHVAENPELELGPRLELEERYPKFPVIWVANPRDDIARSFFSVEGRQRVNKNSVPYIAQLEWMRSVELLAEAADTVVVSSSTNEGGIGEEVQMLVKRNLLKKTFFLEPLPNEIGVEKPRSINELIGLNLCAHQDRKYLHLLDVEPMRHWAGGDSMEYARHYITAINNCAANIHAPSDKQGYEVFATVFLALVAVLVFRAELHDAARFQNALASFFIQDPESYHPYDAFTIEVLAQSAKWYSENADMYSAAHFMYYQSAR